MMIRSTANILILTLHGLHDRKAENEKKYAFALRKLNSVGKVTVRQTRPTSGVKLSSTTSFVENNSGFREITRSGVILSTKRG